MMRQSKTIVEPAGRWKTEGGSVAAPARGRRILWLSTAAVAGLVVMMLELAAFRLYAPYFGYSIYVWGSMIGMVMGGLAVGYALGGWVADVRGDDRWMYLGILASAAYQGAMCFAARGLLAGSFGERGNYRAGAGDDDCFRSVDGRCWRGWDRL